MNTADYPQAVRDFIAAYPYKIELHAHTSPVSSCSQLPPAELIRRLHEQHYDAVVVTNHFYEGGCYMKTDDPVGMYLDDYRAAKEAGEAFGMTVLLGAEFRFRENSNDYLVFGVDEAFLRETVQHFDLTLSEFYERYHAEDRLILQAHPFRNGMVLQPTDHLDGIEAFNMHPNHNSRVAVASRYAREEDMKLITVGTDLHHPGHEGVSSLRAKEIPQDSRALVSLLRSGDYLFEIGGHPLLPYYTF